MSGWVKHVAVFIWLISLGVGILILIVHDEWCRYRSRPKPEAVRAYADELEAAHGRRAFKINGDAMYEARCAKNFSRHRFLKAVSGELTRRFFRGFKAD